MSCYLKKQTIAKSFSLLAALTIFEKIIAFVFEAIIASVFGSNATTDAYFSASEIIGVVDTAFLSSLTVIALNRYSHWTNTEGDEKAFDLLSRLMSFYLPLMLGISAAIYIFADPLTYIVAPGYGIEARDALVRCIRIMAAIPIISCITSFDLAVLRNKKQFMITGLKSLFISVFGILGVVTYAVLGGNGSDILSTAFVVSMLAFCILTFVRTRKYGKLQVRMPTFTAEVRITVFMLLPLMASYGIDRVSLMVGKVISSMLGEGSVSSLNYAHSLYKVVTAVFITNLATILLTDFNELFAQEKYDAVAQKIRSVVSVMTVVLIPITIISIVCSNDVVKIVYERGSFTPESTKLVGSVLLVYAINFIPAMIHSLYNQVMYSKGDTKSPMWIALISIAVNISVSVSTINVIGLAGVALGTVVASVIAVLACRFVVQKHLPEFHGCYSVRFAVSCVISGIACYGAVFLVKLLALPAFFSFIMSTVAGVVSFGAMMLLLRDEIAMGILQKGMRILKSKK